MEQPKDLVIPKEYLDELKNKIDELTAMGEKYKITPMIHIALIQFFSTWSVIELNKAVDTIARGFDKNGNKKEESKG